MKTSLLYKLDKLPYFIKVIPYKFGEYLIKFIFRSSHIKVWIRHSLYFKNITFALSDIDFTFFTEKALSKKEIEKILIKFNKIKKILPFLGEINFLNREESLFLYKSANPYELDRDPILKMELGKVDIKKNKAYELCYLARMLEADKKNIFTRFYLRKKKWNFHFSQIEKKWEDHNLKNGINYLIKNLQLPSPNFFHRYLQIVSDEQKFFLYKDRTFSKDFITFYPHRFSPISFGRAEIENYKDIFESLDEVRAKVLYYQVNWEIWGIMTQYLLLKKQHLDYLPTHFKNLSAMISFLPEKNISSKDKEDIYKQISYLVEKIEKINSL